MATARRLPQESWSTDPAPLQNPGPPRRAPQDRGHPGAGAQERAQAERIDTPEVIAVLHDLFYWRIQGVCILMVEPTPGGGVHVGVRSDPAVAEQLMRLRYRFPVRCSAQR